MMSATLDVYTHIFSSIQEQKEQQDQAHTLLGQVPPSQRSEVEMALQHLQQKMERLKRSLRQMSREQEEVLARLKAIEVRKVPPQAGSPGLTPTRISSSNPVVVFKQSCFLFHFKTTK